MRGMTGSDVMHTVAVILGVIANIFFALAIISIVVGLVWVMFPLKDKHYLGSVEVYQYYYPLGGRMTGLCILAIGIASLALGFLLDRVHFRLISKFGSRT